MSDEHIEIILPTVFGLEAVVAREARQLGYDDTQVENGRVTVRADLAAICRLNLWLRSAERVQWKIAEFEAADFDALFEQTKALPWERWLPVDAAFPVTGKSVRSQLSHVPTCQGMIKKAVVESLRKTHQRERFDETGPKIPIEFALLNNRLTLVLNTSGPGLHKRGYRTWIGPSPLKETLAAGLIQLSFWNAGRPFWDPFCGTGTLPIEAAMIGRNIAPGLQREFIAERWPIFGNNLWKESRNEAREQKREPLTETLMGTDIDDRSLDAARKHAENAGVATDVCFEKKPVLEIASHRRYGCLICNPPYGERSGELATAEKAYDEMRRVFPRFRDWSYYVLTSHAGFEKLFDRRADRKRKLYNGRIECAYYQYQGPKPPYQARPKPNAATTETPDDSNTRHSPGQ